ncbi:RNA dependent RNA polymerase [Clostridium perfringens]|uniref:RNA dependent RNA polymerase n=1 Tax=Clostridium perfringens TaxID=1502 RepID=UPI0039EB1311
MLKKKRLIVREVNREGAIQEIGIFESPVLNLLFELEGKRLFDGDVVDYLVKAPINKSNTKKTITVDGKQFIFWISTSSQMKNSEAWYIRKDKAHLVIRVEDLLSTGKLETLKGKEVSINKDIIARLSLAFSGSYKTTMKPNMIIVPDVEYSVFKDVKIFEENELVNKDNFEIKVTAFDGCGLMSPQIAERIARDLKMDYIPSWVTIRSPKMAVKGLLTNVDFIRFFNDTYTHDTEYFKKIGENFYIKDVFGQFQKVDDNTIIINESMAKWAKFYSSMEEYNNLVDNSMVDLLECLYITKIGKIRDKHLTKTSYQSLCATALTKASLLRMTQSQVKFYKNCMDMDKIAVMELLGLEAKVSEIEEDIEATLTSDKIATLLSIDFDRFIKLPWIKREILKMINKKIAQLSTGKFLIEGNFKVMVSDPISFMNYCMTRELVPNLGSREFYIKDEAGKEVATVRYPVASPFELTKEKIVANKDMDRYCNYTDEMIVFNVAGCDALIKSGADFDGDIVQVIYNQDFINNIIETDRIFYNILSEQAKTIKLPYNSSNRFNENIKYCGNLIGSIAILGASIMDKALEEKWVENGEIVSYLDIYNRFERESEKTREYLSSLKKIEQELSEEQQRQYFQSQFEADMTNINKVVELSMVSIDSPKTGIMADTEVLRSLKSEFRKPKFMAFLVDKEIDIRSCSYHTSSLSAFNNYVYESLIKPFQNEYKENVRVSITSNCLLEAISNINFVESNDKNVETIFNTLEEAIKIYSNKMREINTVSVFLNEDNERVYESLSKEEKRRLKEPINLICQKIMIDLKSEFSNEDICMAIYKLLTKGSSVEFIFNFCFDLIVYCLQLKDRTVTQLVANPNGQYQGLFNSYDLKTFTKEGMEEKLVKKQNFETKRLMEKLAIRMSLLNPEEVENLGNITINGLEVIENGQVIGKIFIDSLNKVGIGLDVIQGERNVLVFEKNKKSAKIVIE